MAAAIAAGAFGEAAGFATGNKPLLLISFAVLMAGQTRLARTDQVMVRPPWLSRFRGMQHPSSSSLTCKRTVKATDWRGPDKVHPDRWP
jgi:hypothetical protein